MSPPSLLSLLSCYKKRQWITNQRVVIHLQPRCAWDVALSYRESLKSGEKGHKVLRVNEHPMANRPNTPESGKYVGQSW